MPFADVGGVKLFYEETGAGAPLVFVHEFAGDHQSWHLQVRFFSRRYRTIAYNARGYPPSDVPDKPEAYSQQQEIHAVQLLPTVVRFLSIPTRQGLWNFGGDSR